MTSLMACIPNLSDVFDHNLTLSDVSSKTCMSSDMNVKPNETKLTDLSVSRQVRDLSKIFLISVNPFSSAMIVVKSKMCMYA